MSTWDTLIALKLAACIAWKGQKYDYDGYEGAGRWWCGHFTGFECRKKKHLLKYAHAVLFDLTQSLKEVHFGYKSCSSKTWNNFFAAKKSRWR